MTIEHKKQTSRRGSVFLEKYSKVSDYKKKYEYISILGNGGFGKVRLYRDRVIKNMKFAIKTLKKDIINDSLLNCLVEEVKILRDLDHPNIVKYFETYEDNYYLHIVMEYIPGENLFKVITNRKYNNFSEKNAAEIFNCLLKAVKFLHTNNIVHRDIKPENILFSVPGNYQSLKLIDFGLSASTRTKEKNRVGSPYYMAPEMLDGQYSHATDMWSIGVILFVMMTGSYPFPGKNHNEVFAKIEKGVYNMQLLDKQKVSPEVKDLIKKLLVIDQRRRLSTQAASEHPWVIKYKDLDTTNYISDNIIDSLKCFVNNNPFQKEILFYLAKISSESEISALKQAFLQIDR